MTTVPPLDQETADLEVSGGDSQTDREELSHSITDLEAQVDTLRRAESLALEKVTTLEDELKNLKTLEEVWHHCFVLFLSLCLCLAVFVSLYLFVAFVPFTLIQVMVNKLVLYYEVFIQHLEQY